MLQNIYIIIQKVDKSNTSIFIDKHTYKIKKGAIISDRAKFEKLDVQEKKALKFFLVNKKDFFFKKKKGKLLKSCMKKVISLKMSIFRSALQEQNQSLSTEKLKLKN